MKKEKLILLADENIDFQIVNKLRSKGYEVIYILEMDPSISDELVLSIAQKKRSNTSYS